MQNFNPQAQSQPTIQRESYLFIQCTKCHSLKECKEENLPLYVTEIFKYKIAPDEVRDCGIGAIVANHVQSLVKDAFEIENVYVGSLL